MKGGNDGLSRIGTLFFLFQIRTGDNIIKYDLERYSLSVRCPRCHYSWPGDGETSGAMGRGRCVCTEDRQ